MVFHGESSTTNCANIFPRCVVTYPICSHFLWLCSIIYTSIILDFVRLSEVFLIHAYVTCRVDLLWSCFTLHWHPFSKISFYKNSCNLIKKNYFFCSCTKVAQHNYSQSSYGAEETTDETSCIWNLPEYSTTWATPFYNFSSKMDH